MKLLPIAALALLSFSAFAKEGDQFERTVTKNTGNDVVVNVSECTVPTVSVDNYSDGTQTRYLRTSFHVTKCREKVSYDTIVTKGKMWSESSEAIEGTERFSYYWDNETINVRTSHNSQDDLGMDILIGSLDTVALMQDCNNRRQGYLAAMNVARNNGVRANCQ